MHSTKTKSIFRLAAYIMTLQALLRLFQDIRHETRYMYPYGMKNHIYIRN